MSANQNVKLAEVTGLAEKCQDQQNLGVVGLLD